MCSTVYLNTVLGNGKLTELERIETMCMKGFGDRSRTRLSMLGILRKLVDCQQSTDEDNLNIIEDNLQSTELASTFNVAPTGIHITKYDLSRIRLLHELSDDDFNRRNQFCNNDNNFIEQILFSDEATFIFHYWITNNPHWFSEFHTQNTQKVNMWCSKEES